MFCPICVKEWQRPILIIGLSVASGQWFISLGWAPVAAGAASGFITGFASTGNVNGAMQGAFSGGLFGAAGMVGDAPNSFARYAAHAAAGCISAVASSGHCGPGAVAAVFGKYTTNAIGDSSILSDSVSKGVATSVAGGVGSMIAGGKFENGAVTAAYGYLFNHLAQRMMAARPMAPIGGKPIGCDECGGQMGGYSSELRVTTGTPPISLPDISNVRLPGFLGLVQIWFDFVVNSVSSDAANLGYDRLVKDPPFNSHGQKVFTNGSDYITPDVDKHNGGSWKMFDRRGNRVGTFDGDLNRIGK